MIEGSKTALPRTLYKYCPPERIDIISHGQIRFSRPSDFNDTFDTQFRPPVAEMESPRERLDRARRRDKLGILCLAKNPDNHLMWVNYARDHAGFVIGFKMDAPFFAMGGKDFRRVSYGPRPSDSPKEDACFYKSPDWRYEEEWRYVRTFGDSEDRLVGIPEDLITEIAFGHRMKESDIAQIVLCNHVLGLAGLHGPKFFLSTPDHSFRKFVNKPKTVAYCKHCGGHGYRMENLVNAEHA